MARIPDTEIDRLKKEVSLERLCDRYDIKLTRQGKNLVGFCPWHEDDSPSFIVTPDKNLWHCMGACDEGGDVFSLVMKAEKVSFRRAAEILLELAGRSVKTPTVTTPVGTSHAILVQPDDGLSGPELLTHVASFYHQSFVNDPKAMQYLESRCCLQPEAIKRFTIGYANRTLGYRIPGTTVSGKELKERLKSLGVLRQSGHEHLSGSVVFPLFDLNGNPVQLYGRKITAGLRKGTPDHLYLEGPLRGIWNREGVARQKTWILCESIIDGLTLWCHGRQNVTCCFGKNTFSKELWELLEKVRPTRIIVAFDNDEPGNKAADKLAPDLAAAGASVYRASVPLGKDINEYVCHLAGKDPRAVAGILEGLFADATLILRADPGEVDLPLPALPEEPQSKHKKSSFLAANLAAEQPATKEKNNPQPQEIPAEQKGEDIEIRLGDRSYRIRGLARNQSFEVLKINLRLMCGALFHVDSFDLYNARHRATFINTAAVELQLKAEIIKKDLGKVLLKLEELQDERINKTLAGKEQEVAMTGAERQEAMELLKDPQMLTRILADFATYGLVGEETNKLTGFLAAVSRKLEKPLAVIVQSMSAAGKSTLMEAILAMIPEEDKIQYSAMTGQSLFYLGEKDLKHKVLAIVEEEGAQHASYALKLLQSEGQLTIASTGKDNASGQMVTKEYRVEGPVMILTTTTAIDIDEELLNRCLILTVDETREQTRAIHQQQRRAETLEGLKRRLAKKDALTTQRNAQRLLMPLQVVNPFADRLTFLDNQTRTRRDHQKYLTLIKTIAFLHQYQRPIKTLGHGGEPVRYIEVSLDDIKAANRLAREVLGRSLDELPPQTRRFLSLVADMVTAACREKEIEPGDYRFTQREVREHTAWSDYQVKSHMRKLVELEYILVHRGGRGQCFVYELLYKNEGENGSRFLMGLLGEDKLVQLCSYDPDREHEKTEREVSGSTEGAAKEYGGSTDENDVLSRNHAEIGKEETSNPEKGYIRPEKTVQSSNRTGTSSLAEQV